MKRFIIRYQVRLQLLHSLRRSIVRVKISEYELRTISENEDWLTEHLTGEEKKRFLDFADAWSAYNGAATLDGFITGFRLGARFVLDAFVLPEASPQNYSQDKQ